MSSKKPVLNIVTDSTGFFKVVSFNDKAIPATDATIYLNSHEQAQVELTVAPVELNISAELCSVSMRCPVCEFYQVHRCEVAEEQDDNCTG